MPVSIAEYLLFLARDSEAGSRHNASDTDAAEMMRDFGLSEEQSNIVLGKNTDEIRAAVENEISAGKRSAEDLNLSSALMFYVHLALPDSRDVS